jgi:hypothetical protein
MSGIYKFFKNNSASPNYVSVFVHVGNFLLYLTLQIVPRERHWTEVTFPTISLVYWLCSFNVENVYLRRGGGVQMEWKRK